MTRVRLRMILKINTTIAQKVTVELIDKRIGIKDKLVKTQKLGSQALLPLIVKILKKNRQSLRSSSSKDSTAGLKLFKGLTAIEVNCGPGSFTGTRVGVTVANALGFALNIPVNGKLGKITTPVYEKSKFD